MNSLLIGLLVTQAQFISVLGGEHEEMPRAMAVTLENGFVIAGYSTSFDIDHSMDIIVSRFDEWGNHMWTRIQGGPSDEEALRVGATQDGGVVILGVYGETSISKFDVGGNLLWARVLDVFGASGGGTSMCMITTTDGGFALAGGAIETAPGFCDALVVRLNSSGFPVWTRTVKVLRPTINEYATHIIQSADGGFITVGSLEQGFGDPAPPFNPNIIITRFDPMGNHLWTRLVCRNNEDYEHATGVISTPDGGVIVAGTISQLLVESQDVIVFKMDGSGNLLWENSLATAEADITFSLTATPDGGFAIAGGTGFRLMGNDYDMFLSRFDPNGNHLWTRTFGGNFDEWADQVIATPEGTLVVAGPTWSFGSGECDIMFSRFDNEGNHLGNWIVGGPNRDWSDYAMHLAPDPKGEFVVVSTTASFGAGEHDFILVKYDSSGKTCMGESVELKIDSTRWGTSGIMAIDPGPTITSITPTVWAATTTSAAPNFASLCSSLNAGEAQRQCGMYLLALGRLVRFALATPGETRLSVYDPMGRLVARPVNGNITSGEHGVELSLRKGVYFVELVATGITIRAKTVIR